MSLFAKLGLSAALPLASDEAYYWVWSHRLQLSYFDHPPMVAALLWLGHPFELLGSAVRWPLVLVGHLTLIVWQQLFRNQLSEDQAVRWLWLSLLTPIVGFGSLIATPDVPLLFFWSLSLLFYSKTLEQNSRRWYLLLGLSLGLGFISKYHMVLLVPILVADLYFKKQLRRLLTSRILLTLFAGLMACLPVLIWNYQNDWKSFLFQLHHGLGRSHWNVSWTLGYLIGQALLIGPLFWPEIRGSLGRLKLDSLFKMNSIGNFGFFLFSSFRGVVEANWPSAGYSSLHALLAKSGISKCRFRTQLGCWSAVVVSALVFFYVAPPAQLPESFADLKDYRAMVELVKTHTPLYANSYQMASILSFETKTFVPKLNDMSRYDYFDDQLESYPQASTFYLIRHREQKLPGWLSLEKYQVSIVKEIPSRFELLRIDLR